VLLAELFSLFTIHAGTPLIYPAAFAGRRAASSVRSHHARNAAMEGGSRSSEMAPVVGALSRAYSLPVVAPATGINPAIVSAAADR
jgi:hypothetical protein